MVEGTKNRLKDDSKLNLWRLNRRVSKTSRTSCECGRRPVKFNTQIEMIWMSENRNVEEKFSSETYSLPQFFFPWWMRFPSISNFHPHFYRWICFRSHTHINWGTESCDRYLQSILYSVFSNTIEVCSLNNCHGRTLETFSCRQSWFQPQFHVYKSRCDRHLRPPTHLPQKTGDSSGMEEFSGYPALGSRMELTKREKWYS